MSVPIENVGPPKCSIGRGNQFMIFSWRREAFISGLQQRRSATSAYTSNMAIGKYA